MVSTGRLPAPRRRDSHGRSSPRRAELLEIAAGLFAERGFVATAVREIADAAGILSGSLYHHFDSKESMMDEILRQFLDTQRGAFDRVLAESTDARTTITGLIRQSFGVMYRHRAAVTILQNEWNYLARLDRFDYLRRATGEFERTWTRVLRQGQRDGVFRSDLNVKLAYRSIRDSVSATVRWYNPRGRLSGHVVAEQYVTIFCDGIVATGAQTSS